MKHSTSVVRLTSNDKPKIGLFQRCDLLDVVSEIGSATIHFISKSETTGITKALERSWLK
jgi:hypothetical protein